MADNDTAQERTERPTQRRLDEAKKKGQVPRSRELNTTLMLMGSALALYALGGRIGAGLIEGMRNALTLTPADFASPSTMVGGLGSMALHALLLLAPVLAVVVLLALAGPVMLGGWTFSAELLAFKGERIDPLKGLARIFSVRGLVELAKGIVKLMVIGGVGWFFLWYHKTEIFGVAAASVSADLAHAFSLFGTFFLVLAASTLAIAAVDVPYQIWDHRRQLKMTQQEIRDEMKETEGRPEVKSRVRQLQREIAQRRMMDEVPKADVVVTNPTHFAVALRYEPLKANAPKVVAKGADLMAGRIRMVAGANDVPVVEAPPLARALYHSTKLNQEIPAALYLAVAQVLAYVYQLRNAGRSGDPRPGPPTDLPVPEDMVQ